MLAQKILKIALFYFLSLFILPLQAQKNSLHQTLLKLYQDHRVTFFCEQSFSKQGEIEYTPCPHCPKIPTHIQWMPIVPLQKFAQFKHCYHEKLCINKKGERFKGLRCCEEMDAEYGQMAQDLHNYVPEHPVLKKERRNYPFGLVADKTRHAKCHLTIDKKNKIIEPAPELRGFIGRTYLYFYEKYHLNLSLDEIALFSKWDKEVPITSWEQEREKNIQEAFLRKNS